jgi:hypothetical protein
MLDSAGEIVLYEEDRRIKITRFFEVAEFLTKENLWGEVKKLMLENELLGSRIILDQHLGNAVKVVIARHSTDKQGLLDDAGIVRATIRCASLPTRPPRPDPPIPSVPDDK